jgi:hypothetical protein
MSSLSHLCVVFAVAGQGFLVLVGSNKLIGLAFWLAVLAALGALEGLSRLTRVPVPNAGAIVARYLRHPVVRSSAIAVWLYAGWHLFCH